MAGYEVLWVTDSLATGAAPMSYDDLGTIRGQGIDAIVNLCAEYCDLHDIQRDYGFDVYYFPVVDDSAPNIKEMEEALDWLDEAIYLGKKVLVHCRLGLGRTGTFITAYLLRRGFGLKLARERLKRLRPNPTSFHQWRLLRKYDKQSGKLTLREPSIETKNLVDLGLYFTDYERLVDGVEAAIEAGSAGIRRCGRDTDACCHRFLHLQLIEAAYLHLSLNKRLSRNDRVDAAARAIAMHRVFSDEGDTPHSGDSTSSVIPADPECPAAAGYTCPLNREGRCIAYEYRPLTCRLHPIAADACDGDSCSDALDSGDSLSPEQINKELHDISKRLFFALNSSFLEDRSLLFPLTRVVSGKFVQDYFSFLSKI